MKVLQITIESSSNKQLDSFSKEIVKAIRQSGAVKAGPIPFKGKRLIYCYNWSIRTLDLLIKIDGRKYKRFKISIIDTVRPSN